MSSDTQETGLTKAVLVLEFENPPEDIFFQTGDRIIEALKDVEDDYKPRMVRMAIREIAQQVLDVFREEEEMALRKHGEGEVLPDTEQQKTAAQQGGQMDERAREELRAENEAADGVRDDE